MVAFDVGSGDLSRVANGRGRVVVEYSGEVVLAVNDMWQKEHTDGLPDDFLEDFNSEKGIVFAKPQNVYFFSVAQNLAYCASVRRVRSFSHLSEKDRKTVSVLVGFECVAISVPTVAGVLNEVKTGDVSMR